MSISSREWLTHTQNPLVGCFTILGFQPNSSLPEVGGICTEGFLGNFMTTCSYYWNIFYFPALFISFQAEIYVELHQSDPPIKCLYIEALI